MSDTKYFTVVVKKLQEKHALIRVSVDVTEDMTLQAARNVAGMKAIDAVLGDIKLAGQPDPEWEMMDSHLDLSVVSTQLVPPAPPPDYALGLVLNDIYDLLSTQVKASSDWTTFTAHYKRRITGIMDWVRENGQGMNTHNQNKLARVVDKLIALDAPKHVFDIPDAH